MLLNQTKKNLLNIGLLVILVLSANSISNAQTGNGGTPPAGDNGCAHVEPPEDNDSGGNGSNNGQNDGTNGPSCREPRPAATSTPGGGGNTPTPEPVTMLLFGSGLAGVAYARRRFGKAKDETEPTE
jgi:hypothetical protein